MSNPRFQIRRSTISPEIKTGETKMLVNGPGKYDLEKALFDPHGSNARRVELYIDHRFFSATVNTVGIEDGSGECFLFSGIVWGADTPPSSRHYEAFIRTDKRTGWMKFTAD